MGKIALVGLGLVGRAWAVSFARAGHEVAIWDERPEAIDDALAFVNRSCPNSTPTTVARRAAAFGARPDAPGRLARRGARRGELTSRRTRPRTSRPSGGCSPTLDRLADPDAVLASSTSAILPSIFSEGSEGPGALPRRPPDQPALSDPGGRDRSGAVDRSATPSSARLALLKAAGHAPIVMKREIDGFVVNRLQGALLEEAFRLVADGFATTEDVDVAIREGLALRWSFMGPFETIDLNAPGGVRDYAERYQQIYARDLSLDPAAGRLDGSRDGRRSRRERRERLPADQLAERAAWRDRRLMALAAHKRQAEDEIGT